KQSAYVEGLTYPLFFSEHFAQGFIFFNTKKTGDLQKILNERFLEFDLIIKTSFLHFSKMFSECGKILYSSNIKDPSLFAGQALKKESFSESLKEYTSVSQRVDLDVFLTDFKPNDGFDRIISHGNLSLAMEHIFNFCFPKNSSIKIKATTQSNKLQIDFLAPFSSSDVMRLRNNKPLNDFVEFLGYSLNIENEKLALITEIHRLENPKYLYSSMNS
ncbi:MAG: hypothetical protein HRT44_03535, partial [Bdellovibrionales bacterium]|nr:hypothetical protein [Bdellovibrionales bacterium]